MSAVPGGREGKWQRKITGRMKDMCKGPGARRKSFQSVAADASQWVNLVCRCLFWLTDSSGKI